MDRTPQFGETMTRNRFQLLMRFLHFNNTRDINANDPMYRVRPVLDYLVHKFNTLFVPGKNISIDEGMLLWRGRLAFRVYNPLKPIKYGIKLYLLCDSKTGYCSNLLPYTGERRSLHDTVFHLISALEGQGYTLFMDNFYNSVSLCHSLLAAKTNVCGTLRRNRGEPQVIREATPKNLAPGETVVRHNKDVMVLAWRDKQVVKMISTCHHDKMEQVEVWKRGVHHKVSVLKPQCVAEYNRYMNGVDKMDQNITYYPTVRRGLKWTRKFVLYLMQICVFNATILYKQQNRKISQLAFIRKVVRAWTARESRAETEEEEQEVTAAEGGHRPRAMRGADPVHRLDGQLRRHEMVRIPATPKKPRPQRPCRVCHRRGRRRDTTVWCKGCQIPLHHGDCFHVYHTRKDYT